MSDGFTGMYIDFHGEVEVRSSELQITVKTMVTRIGGVIGVWKNVLWTIIFSVTSIGTLISFLRKIQSLPKEMEHLEHTS